MTHTWKTRRAQTAVTSRTAWEVCPLPSPSPSAGRLDRGGECGGGSDYRGEEWAARGLTSATLVPLIPSRRVVGSIRLTSIAPPTTRRRPQLRSIRLLPPSPLPSAWTHIRRCVVGRRPRPYYIGGTSRSRARRWMTGPIRTRRKPPPPPPPCRH